MPAPPAVAPPRRRPRRGVVVGWIVGVAVVLLLAGGAAVVHLSGRAAYDRAEGDLRASIEAATATEESLRNSVQDAEESVASAEQIVAAAADDLVDPAARDAFAASTAATAAAVDEAIAVAGDGVDDDLPQEPFWTWELFGEASALDDRTADTSALDDDMAEAADAIAAGRTGMTDAATAVYASVPAAAGALEAANVSARTSIVLDFRDAAGAVAGQSQVGSGAAVAFTAYAQSAENLRQSAQAELAEKAGPQLGTRLEIEAYARSISGGVVLDFDWEPTAAGVGGPNAIGGTATWNTARGGFSTITFSYSVADWWPDDDARALVTHEVGHAITSKCSTLFDSQNQAANEEWATAWAISMGQTADGNGVQAYGSPSQALIDIAATCR